VPYDLHRALVSVQWCTLYVLNGMTLRLKIITIAIYVQLLVHEVVDICG